METLLIMFYTLFTINVSVPENNTSTQEVQEKQETTTTEDGGILIGLQVKGTK